MFHRDLTRFSSDQLREYASWLEQSERDIRRRVESRGGKRKTAGAGQRDLVLERLIWLLARLGALRHAVADRIAGIALPAG